MISVSFRGGTLNTQSSSSSLHSFMNVFKKHRVRKRAFVAFWTESK